MDTDAANQTSPAVNDQSSTRKTILARITEVIAASLDVSQVIGSVSQLAQYVTHHASLIILLLQAAPDVQAGEQLIVGFSHPTNPQITSHPAWSPTAFSFGDALQAGQPYIVDDLAIDVARHPGNQRLLAAGRAALIVPISTSSGVLGGLVLISCTPRDYQLEDMRSARAIADLFAIALEHQRLDEQSKVLAVMEERNRLAREIHDTLAQSLAGIIATLEALKPYDRLQSRTESELLGLVEALAHNALNETRRCIQSLCPTALESHSLRDALASELADLTARAAITTQFHVCGRERPLLPDQAAALFRICQEALQNIYKHAAASHATLTMAFEAQAIVLTVEDDGSGFLVKTGESNKQEGFGLLSMVTRARDLGGELQITCRAKHGTTVRVVLPYACPTTATGTTDLEEGVEAIAAPATRPVRVLVVDDHTIVREGIQHVLGRYQDIQVVGEAGDGLTAVEETARLRPDVILMDIQMPGLSGIDALSRLREAHPNVEVVMLTMFDQDEQVFASLRAGAKGFVPKDAPSETVVAAVRAASRRQSMLPPSVTTRVVDRFKALARQDVDPDGLTGREVEILEYMAAGMRYKEIAERLHITPKTVQYHATNILRKLHAQSRGEAVAVATKRGWIGELRQCGA